MKDLTITAIIKVYQYDELNEADRSLMKTAMEATARSYAPYSHFSVRCRRTAEQRNHCDGNQSGERSLPVGTLCGTYYPVLCQLAVSRQPVNTLAIAARTEKDFIETPIPPCGACRQVILETEKRYGQLSVFCYTAENVSTK